jgi:hypothetical protein
VDCVSVEFAGQCGCSRPCTTDLQNLAART